jgi:hypothetical protein
VLVRYRLDAQGRVTHALAVGEGADHVVRAEASDAEGLSASATGSLRARLEALCADLPGGVQCWPGLLP